MQASTYAVKGGIGFGVQKRTRILKGFGESQKPSLGLRMTDRTTCCGLRLSSIAMEAELTSARVGANGIFRSLAKPRSVKAQASGLFMKYLVFLFNFKNPIVLLGHFFFLQFSKVITVLILNYLVIWLFVTASCFFIFFSSHSLLSSLCVCEFKFKPLTKLYLI